MPATSCARRNELTASSYCSRKRELTIASRKLNRPSATVYQWGRGSDPIIEVGSTILADPLNIALDLLVAEIPMWHALDACDRHHLAAMAGCARRCAICQGVSNRSITDSRT